jgi:hypothetical protein
VIMVVELCCKEQQGTKNKVLDIFCNKTLIYFLSLNFHCNMKTEQQGIIKTVIYLILDKMKSRNKCQVSADWLGGPPKYSLFFF